MCSQQSRKIGNVEEISGIIKYRGNSVAMTLCLYTYIFDIFEWRWTFPREGVVGYGHSLYALHICTKSMSPKVCFRNCGGITLLMVPHIFSWWMTLLVPTTMMLSQYQCHCIQCKTTSRTSMPEASLVERGPSLSSINLMFGCSICYNSSNIIVLDKMKSYDFSSIWYVAI